MNAPTERGRGIFKDLFQSYLVTQIHLNEGQTPLFAFCDFTHAVETVRRGVDQIVDTGDVISSLQETYDGVRANVSSLDVQCIRELKKKLERE